MIYHQDNGTLEEFSSADKAMLRMLNKFEGIHVGEENSAEKEQEEDAKSEEEEDEEGNYPISFT